MSSAICFNLDQSKILSSGLNLYQANLTFNNHSKNKAFENMVSKGKNSGLLIVWCLMPFSTVFQLYRGGQSIYPCFPRVLLTSTPHNILSKPLAASPHNHC